MAKLWKNFLINIKRERFMTVASTLIMTVTFLILGIFVMIVALSQSSIKTLEDQAQLTVFFKDDFTPQSILDLKKSLEADRRVSWVSYVSKEDAFKIFTALYKNQPSFLNSISKEVLPASIQIRTKNISDLSPIANELGKKDGVEEIKFFKDVLDRFRSWSNAVYTIGILLVLLFLLVSYAVIVITLRITISAKGSELEVLKLVGASDGYVKAPLIFQGVFFGAVSALASGLLLFAVVLVARASHLLPDKLGLAIVPGIKVDMLLFSFLLSLGLVLSGVFLGYLGSYTAVKKYLKY